MTPGSFGSTPLGRRIAFCGVINVIGSFTLIAVLSADRRVRHFPACALIGARIRPPQSPASTSNETPQPRLEPALPIFVLLPISAIFLLPLVRVAGKVPLGSGKVK